MANPLFFRFTSELKKIGYRFYVFLLLGVPVGIFLITSAFILFKSEALAEQPLSLLISNNLGFWYALLYPFLLLVITQNLVEVESSNNLLSYGKAYKTHWIDTFLFKVAVALLMLILITLVNIGLNLALFKLAGLYMEASDNNEVLTDSTFSFLKLIPAFIPAIFFHLMVCFALQKAGLAYLVGIMLIVIGIPIANLTDYALIPYSFGIVAVKPNAVITWSFLMGLSVVVGSPIVTNAILRK
ncbi:MAG: hypothetical protein AAF655_27620 [Bacteroidota bacterium]